MLRRTEKKHNPTKKKLFLVGSKGNRADGILHDAMIRFLRKNRPDTVDTVPANLTKNKWKVVADLRFYLVAFNMMSYIILEGIRKKRKFAAYEFGGVDIGRYAAAAALREPKACTNKRLYNRRLLRSATKAIFYYIYALQVSKTISYAYLHEPSYLNGVLVDTFLKGDVEVFLRGYPHNLVLASGPYSSQLNLLVRRENRDGFSEQCVDDYMHYRIDRPRDSISYLKVDEDDKSLTIPDGECAVIYVHSFTDSQLRLGYDGFNSVYDWLTFTVEKLILEDVNVLLKGHPGFWSGYHEASVKQWDRAIWEGFVSQYGRAKNVTIIDWPVNNGTFLSKLHKANTVLISHHSNAIVEGAFLGFKTISSICSLWADNYQFGNVWRSPGEYEELLSKPFRCLNIERIEAMRFIFDKYLNPQGFHSKNFWYALIAKHMNSDIEYLSKNPSRINKQEIDEYSVLLEEISESIIQMQ